MAKIQIDGQELKNLIEYGYNSLFINKTIINDLNVFPIPDGDTGDNMCMTLEGGLKLIKKEESNSVSDISEKCSIGMLNAARGNSGVILSQFFDGFYRGVKGKETISLNDIITAFRSATEQGYLAVDQPTEGTMLTVARESTESLENSRSDLEELSLADFNERLLNIIKTSVDKTPEKLEKLKENGVVDSGGAGLYYIIEGCYKYLHGESISVVLDEQEVKTADLNKFNENSVLEFGYCSEVLLQLTRNKTDVDSFDVDKLKEFLNSIGNSLVVVKTGYVVKIHVHTFEPYKLLEYCGRYGEFLKVKIENMMLQHNEANIQNNFAPKPIKSEKRKKYGVVTVASGEGVKELFKNFGADVVIDGGQTNNPPSSDFIDAFIKINAETIFVFPNNSNVILTAKQAAKSYKASDVVVIESKNIGEGYAGLSMLDFTSEEKEIENTLNEEIKNTVCGAITTATRTTFCNGIAINKGDYLGLIKDIVCCDATRIRAIYKLIDVIKADVKDNALLIYGKNIEDGEKTLIKQYLTHKYPHLEVYEVDGMQNVYDLYIVLN